MAHGSKLKPFVAVTVAYAVAFSIISILVGCSASYNHDGACHSDPVFPFLLKEILDSASSLTSVSEVGAP